MAYTVINFKTKKALRAAVKAHEDCCAFAPVCKKAVTCYAPGLGTVPINGPVYLEGPHYPAMHTWYAQGEMRDGVLVKVK